MFRGIAQGKVQATAPLIWSVVSWEEKSIYGAKHTIEMPTTSCETEGLATAIPATALVTDTAGVKTPSAKVKAVPNIHFR